MSEEEQEVSGALQDVVRVSGRVMWFNSVKGYGFLTPDGGQGDVFLHHSVLRAAGHEEIKEGATLECDAVNGPKGLQAVGIISVDNSTAEAIHLDDDDYQLVEPEGDFLEATTKWFNVEKGYGFVTSGEDAPDIFIHIKALRRLGVDQLLPGQNLRIRVGTGPKGPQVADVELL